MEEKCSGMGANFSAAKFHRELFLTLGVLR
jgi:hypothetical protein